MTTPRSSREYRALVFRQRPTSPLQVAFIAPSSDIDAWARVPTKQTANVRNFQRAQIEAHVSEVEKFFFNSDANASPTAVVVGFDPIRGKDRVRLRRLDEIIDGKTKVGGVIDGKELQPGETVEGIITVDWTEDQDPQTAADLREAIDARRPELEKVVLTEVVDICKGAPVELTVKKLRELLALFASTTNDGGETNDTSEASDTDERPDEEALGDDKDDVDDALSSAADDEVAIPKSVKNELQGLSPSELQIVAGRLRFLSTLQPTELQHADEKELRDLYREVRDELKPGLLIDGQHRVLGTCRHGRIPFLVTALPQADWPELAFQFIVTNRTARKVQESLLISIVGNSLSKSQRGEIEGRLREAGIRVGLIEAVMRVHEDETSPFFGRLAFGLRDEKGFLDAAAMRNKVVQLWYERRPPVRQLFDHFCQGRTAQEKYEYWMAEDKWFEFFKAFWATVQERYEGSDVFSLEVDADGNPVSRLMYATVLKLFQETILKRIEEYLSIKQINDNIPIKESIPTVEQFTTLLKNNLRRLTPEFFTGWGAKGFDGSATAKQALIQAIELVITGEKNVNDLKKAKGAGKPHLLFQPNEKEQKEAKGRKPRE